MDENRTFVSRVSATTGKVEWVLQHEKYDYYQEIARSAYADMLHDEERNKKYCTALEDAINLLHQRGKPAHVLDIGTGTGLLSMMAARAGADSVTACEAFNPMAECAKKIMSENGFAEKINLIHKRSTEVTVGPDCDMPHRANILVTEVFDTELIGEGALGTFQHAHKYLLEEDCIVVPPSSVMYIQVVESQLAANWNTVNPITIPGRGTITAPQELTSYNGAASLHDIQLDQLPESEFKAVTDPIEIFRFDFSGKTKIQFDRNNVKEVEAKTTGKCHAIFMWWDLQMDTRGRIGLSCAPRWAHPEPKNMQWRDHWMQAVFYPNTPLEVTQGEAFLVQGVHDEYSLWFDVWNKNTQRDKLPKTIPSSASGLHLVYSRSRLGTLNDRERNDRYIRAMQKLIKPDSVCLCVSDGSTLPLIAAKLGAKKVFVSDTAPASKRVCLEFIKHNQLENTIKVLEKDPTEITAEDLEGNEITVLLAEPYYYTSTLPWHSLYFWYARTHLYEQGLLSSSVQTMPQTAVLKAIPVEFEHLWKIRAPVGNCEGFDISLFDKLIENASNISDDHIEPQPLWEYPSVALGEETTLLKFDLTELTTQLDKVNIEGVQKFLHCGSCNGVALWMEYQLDVENTITTGLSQSSKPGQKLQWDYYTRQGVFLLKKPKDVDLKSTLKYTAKFDPSTGEIELDFNIT